MMAVKKKKKLVQTKAAVAPMEMGEMRLVEAASINVDPFYQRQLEDVRCKKLAKSFRAEALGACVAGQRDDMTLNMIDGQHRQRICELVGHKHVWCIVLPSSGPVFEAELFCILNTDRKAPSHCDLFRSRLAARQAFAVNVYAAVRAAGFEVYNASNPPEEGRSYYHLKCTKCLEDIYKLKGGGRQSHLLLKKTLRTAKATYGNRSATHKKYGYSNFVFHAIGRLFNRFGTKCSADRVSTVLGKMAPEEFTESIADTAKIIKRSGTAGGSRPAIAEYALALAYNKQLRKDKKLDMLEFAHIFK